MPDSLSRPLPLQLRAPACADEWDQYFDLRWRVLRAPWEQPRGSERDALEADCTHLGVWDQNGRPIAVGRLHFNTPSEAQVRFMAVQPGSEGTGFGGRILAGLEAAARERGARRIVLNAREGARGFYERHGYAAIGPAETMFGQIAHTQMAKTL